MGEQDLTTLAKRMRPLLVGLTENMINASEGPGIDIAARMIGVGLDSILVQHDNNDPASEYPASDAGFAAALAAVVDYDILILPSVVLANDYTIPAKTTILGYGLSATFSGEITLSADVFVYNVSFIRTDTVDLNCVVGPGTGTAELISCRLSATSTAGTAACVLIKDGSVILRECILHCSSTGTDTEPILNRITSFLIDSQTDTPPAGVTVGTITAGWTGDGSDRVVGWGGGPVASYNLLFDPPVMIQACSCVYYHSHGYSSGELIYYLDGVAINTVSYSSPATMTGPSNMMIDRVYFGAYPPSGVNVYLDDFTIEFLGGTGTASLINCQYDVVTGIPLLGDRSAYDADTYPDVHANDLDTSTGIHHTLGTTAAQAASGDHTHAYVPTSLTITAGDGLTGGGDLTENRTISLGIPSAVSATTTDSASGTTHSHSVTASSAPGAAESLLKTSATGGLTLAGKLSPSGGITSPYTRYLVVDAGGKGDYATIKEACDYVATQTRAIATQWVIHVMPGHYDEYPFTIPTYTTVTAISEEFSQRTVSITSAAAKGWASGGLITLAGASSTLSYIDVTAAGATATASKSAVLCAGSTGLIIGCRIRNPAASTTYSVYNVDVATGGNVHLRNCYLWTFNMAVRAAHIHTSGTGTFVAFNVWFTTSVNTEKIIFNESSGSSTLSFCRLFNTAAEATNDIDTSAGTIVINNSSYFKKTGAGAINQRDRWFNSISGVREAPLATDVPLTIKGATSHTANLTEWQSSAGTVWHSISLTGAVFNENGDASSDFRVESDTESNMILVDANADTDGAIYLGGTTNGIKISKGGDVKFIGAGAGLQYGSMYCEDTTINTTATLAGAYYGLASGMTGGLENGCTFQNSCEIKILTAGVYQVNWSMSISVNASDQTIEGIVMAGAAGTTAQVQTGNAARAKENGVVYSVSGTGLITCAVNDLIRLGVENETSAGKVITTNHANLVVKQIGS
jgi:hypothetical protein